MGMTELVQIDEVVMPQRDLRVVRQSFDLGGNVATEHALYMTVSPGAGIDFDTVLEAGQFISRHLVRPAARRADHAISAKRNH